MVLFPAMRPSKPSKSSTIVDKTVISRVLPVIMSV